MGVVDNMEVRGRLTLFIATAHANVDARLKWLRNRLTLALRLTMAMTLALTMSPTLTVSCYKIDFKRR